MYIAGYIWINLNDLTALEKMKRCIELRLCINKKSPCTEFRHGDFS